MQYWPWNYGYGNFVPNYVSAEDAQQNLWGTSSQNQQPWFWNQTPTGWYNTPVLPPITPLTPFWNLPNMTQVSIPYIPLPQPEVDSSSKILRISTQLYNTPSFTYPHLKWDVAQFPSTALRAKAPGQTTAPKFDNPAVRPFRSNILISSVQQGLYHYMSYVWGPIRVSRNDGHPITVEDAMDAIFDYFQAPLPRVQVSTPVEWDSVKKAWKSRMKDSPNSYTREFEKARGALRIDLLAAHCGTKFGGLRLRRGGFDGSGIDGLLLSITR